MRHCLKIFITWLLSVTLTTGANASDASAIGAYDLARLKIEDPAAIETFGTDILQVRLQSYDLQKGEYPVLRLKRVSRHDARGILYGNLQRFSDADAEKTEVVERDDILRARAGKNIFWVRIPSGSYNCQNTRGIMSEPSSISDHKEAVQIAVKHMAAHKIVSLAKDETIDIISVNQIMNALVEDKGDNVLEEYGSDYIVVFGRRFRGVPVVGSYLQVRLGQKGALLGVSKHWRTLSGAIDETVSVESRNWDHVTRAHLINNQIAKDQAAETIEIVARSCGYIEGSSANHQDLMGLGCVVSYRHANGEMVANTVIPFQTYDFPLLGEQPKFIAAQKSNREIPVSDPDDKREGQGKGEELR